MRLGATQTKTKRSQGPPGGKAAARGQLQPPWGGRGHNQHYTGGALRGAPRRSQVLRTYSERLTTGRMTRNTTELTVVTMKNTQNRILSTAMAMTRHSLSLFFSASSRSCRLKRIFSARMISSWARLLLTGARFGL